MSYPGAYDGGRQVEMSHDPSIQFQAEVDKIVKQAAQNLIGLVGAGMDVVEEIIKNVVDTIIGFVSIPGAMLQNLGEWVQNLDTYIGNVFKALGEFNLWDPDFNVFQWADHFIDAIIRPIGKLLGIDDPIPAFNLFGTISGRVLGMIPVESIGGQSDWNFLSNPIFTDNALVVAGEWILDSTRKHSVQGNSVKVQADGTDHDLYSELHEVTPGQKIPMRMWTSWTGLVATGAAIQIFAVPFIEDAEQPSVLLEEIVSPGTNQDTWVQLNGTYTVPKDSTITHVALRLHVESTATAGWVYFSDGGVGKALAEDLVKLEWVEDLIPALDGIDEFVQVALGNILQAITGLPFIGWLFEDLFEEVNSWFDDTQVTAGRADDAWVGLNDTIGKIVDAVFGQTSTNPDDAGESIRKIYRDTLENSKKITALQAKDSADQAVGKIVEIDFGQYPDGPMPANLFDIVYSGPGASRLRIRKGQAEWDKATNATVTAFLRSKSGPTDTNFQIFRGSMGNPPEDTVSGGRPYFYVLARLSDAATTTADGGISCVWARAWSVGSFFLYRADIGCTINGVEYVWVSDIPLTWSFDMSFVIGVGTNERQYQVWSGNSLQYTYTENVNQPGGLSKLAFDTINTDGTRTVDSRYRSWGSIAQLKQDGTNPSTSPNGAGSVAACAIADNELPPVVGSQAMYYRTSTGNASLPGGNSMTPLPANFFQFVGRASRDIATNTATGSFVVSRKGPYLINGRVLLAASYSATIHLVVRVNGQVAQWGIPVYPNQSNMALNGSWVLNLEPGDVVTLATIHNGLTVNGLTGEATGTQTYFDITGLAQAAA